jgi:hypothetical protein
MSGGVGQARWANTMLIGEPGTRGAPGMAIDRKPDTEKRPSERGGAEGRPIGGEIGQGGNTGYIGGTAGQTIDREEARSSKKDGRPYTQG